MAQQGQRLDPSPIRSQIAPCGYTIGSRIRKFVGSHMAILLIVRNGTRIEGPIALTRSAWVFGNLISDLRSAAKIK